MERRDTTRRRDGGRPPSTAAIRTGRSAPRDLAVLLLAASLLSACGGSGEPLPELYPAPDFALTDQVGDTLRAADLEGQAWVVHPFFINCRDVCPVTTGRMADLRDSLAADGLLGGGVRLVSITVDPARDTTEALRRWAEEHGGSPPGHWAFLRGTPPEELRRTIQEGFHLAAMMPGDSMPGDTAAGYQVLHASQVLLVDGRGTVRGVYEFLRPEVFSSLLRDTRRLARETG